MFCAHARRDARSDAWYTLAVVLLAGLFTDSGSRDRYMGFPDVGVKAPSEWVHSEEVSSALISLTQLEKIEPQVLSAVHPPGGLSEAHMYALFDLAETAAASPTGLNNKSVILSRWLLAAEHDLDSNMMPVLPERKSDETLKLFKHCERAVSKHRAEVRRATLNLRQATQRGFAEAAARHGAELERLEREAAARPFSANGGGGGGAPASPGAPAPVVPAAAALLAFLMGTHPRLGAGSPVLHLDADTLGHIAAAVRGKPPPPPSELTRLRREAARLLRWGQHEQHEKERLSAEADRLRAQLEQAGRREAEAEARAKAKARADAATQAALRVELDEAEAWAERQLKEQKRGLEVEWQLTVNRTRNELNQLLATVRADAKRDVAAAHAACDEANEGAAEAWQAVMEMQDQVDVLRSQRVNGLLEMTSKQACPHGPATPPAPAC